MDDLVAAAPRMAEAAAVRTGEVLDALRAVDLGGATSLPGWDRRTLACHLRYGAGAVRRLTGDALAGRPGAYYPGGRAVQRPGTFVPAADESDADVLDEWAATAADLDATWAALDAAAWATPLHEPPGNDDLGSVPLAYLALSRLTEVEVHGTDLGLGLPDWSDVFVDVALPARLARLRTRRSNHRDVDAAVRGSWRLTAPDGFAWLVALDGDAVESRPAEPGDRADATIEASRRDLLALLLGRPPLAEPTLDGDAGIAAAFGRAFPGP